MEWLELILTVSIENSEEACAIANMCVPYGIYIEDYSDLEEGAWEIAHIDLIDEDLLKKDRGDVKIHIFFAREDNLAEATSYLSEMLNLAKIDFTITNDKQNEEDWSNSWKKYFKPTEIGEKLAIVPGWEEYDNKDDRCILTIDPGAAFGTGTHSTTRLCLELLEEYVSTETNVLDIGCGSGILVIAAALLGAKENVGVDIDEVAVKVARENAVKNYVDSEIDFIVGDLTDKVNGKFKVVCANIVADVIVALLNDVENYMDDDSVFICSGIIDGRQNDVTGALEENGYIITEHRMHKNWHAFAAKKRG